MGDDGSSEAAPELTGLVTMLESLQQEWLRAMTGMVEQAASAASGAQAQPTQAGAAEAAGGVSGEMTRLAAPLLRAQAAWLEGGLRYMGRLSQTHGSYLPDLYRRLADASPEGLDEHARRELNDEMRAYLRQLADVSLQEARVLQQRLAELELAFHEPEADDALGAPVRRARAKD